MLIKSVSAYLLAAAAGCLALPASAAAPLDVHADGFTGGKPIPQDYAFCVPASQGHVSRGSDKNPSVSWSKGPADTKSYAIIAVDPDVPSIRTDMNQEGKTLPASMPRVPFYHWVLVDIPPSVTEIPEGADANGAVAHGKPPGPGKIGVRGVNSYTNAFASNDAMKGSYGGYDGPCPPWNDERIHHYHFKVYALDVPSLGLSGAFDGPKALEAMKGHIVAEGEAVGTYTLNPALRPKSGK